MNSTQTFCICSFVVYLIAEILLIVGFAAPYWQYVEVLGTESRSGLWKSCSKGANTDWLCFSVSIGDTPDWFQAVVAFMIMAVIVSVPAGVARMYMPVSAACEITTGIFTLIGIIIYGAEVQNYLGWAYGLATAAGCLFLINGTTLAAFAAKNECTMQKQLPCQSEVEPV